MTKKPTTISNGENKKGNEGPIKGVAHGNPTTSPSLYCIEVPYQKQPCEDDGPFVAITWVNVLKEVSFSLP